MLDMRGVLGLFLVFALALPVRGETEHILDTTKEGMEKIANDLGVKCEYCHPKVKTDGKRDFAAPSEMKTVSLIMKRQIVDKFVEKDGEPIDCAFCHQGKARFLARDTAQAKPTRLAGMARTEIVDLMKGMQQGLGVASCDFCHERGQDGRLDHTIPTENKVIARQMMDSLMDPLLQIRNGKPATCASCHTGKTTFLHRKDKGH
ncbi:MAG: hypothetical protein O3B73_06120 [bacterium]|nr:hypothetical protein [bacterium]